ncbi:Cytochrome c oxidase subunit 7C mitochondrial [Taenia solium]|eukprot:TsM_000295100 transcript=TsM_000295100 gene=TsM_000295100
MATLLARALFPLSRVGVSASRLSSPSLILSRNAIARPAFLQKIYDKLDAVERSIDEEANIGANLPFNIENPRRLALTMILFIGIAFNIPFFITYYQMKAAKSG